MEGEGSEDVAQNQQNETVRALLSNLQHVTQQTLVPQLSASQSDRFALQEFMKQVAEYGGMRPDSAQILEATTILESHGFCSRVTIDGITQDLALEYLKLPVAVWISMKQLIGPTALSQVSTPIQPATPTATTPKPRKKKSKEQITRLALQTKIGQFCDKIGHDQGIFLVKEVDLVQCLVCDSTFKLHKPGQITRLKRHINGETGSQKITRHMRNLLYPKPKEAEKSPSQAKKQLPPYRKRNFQHTEQQMAMQHLKRQRLDLDNRSGFLHCHCLQPAKRMVSKTDNQVFWICSKGKPEQCDFFQLDGQQGDTKLTLEMAELDASEVMENGEKEGLGHPSEDGNLMLGEMGDEHDPSELRDFDIQDKGLVLPSISYLTTTSTTSGSSVPQSDVAATVQEQTQQIQEHQQPPRQEDYETHLPIVGS